MSDAYTITQLSREFDVTTRTIRFYEDQKLLAPKRNGRQRVYSAGDRVRLKLVLRGKRLGFTLSEIRDIINLYYSAPGESAQLTYFLDRISERRQQLLQQKDDIEITLRELQSIQEDCEQRLDVLNP